MGAEVAAGNRSAPPKATEGVFPAPYVPFGGARVDAESWYDSFLSDLAINGGMSLAAAAAGIHRKHVHRAMEHDPVFAEEVEAAKAYYRDLLEWESVDLARRKNNPLPYFARLKAELPARYIDRQALLLAATSIPEDAVDGKALLRAMLGQGSPGTGIAAELPPPAQAPGDERPETADTSNDATGY